MATGKIASLLANQWHLLFISLSRLPLPGSRRPLRFRLLSSFFAYVRKRIRPISATLLAFVVTVWTLHLLLGKYLIDLMYSGKPLWLADRFMPGRAVTSVVSYYLQATTILWAITFCIFALFLLLLLVIKPTEIIISILAVSLCVGAGEFAARLVYQDITTTPDNASYFARRWQQTVRLNSWRFRDKEFAPVKPEGVYRIAVIGDSIAYGQGIKLESRFTNLLQRRLSARDSKYTYEVLNFARPGAETVDHVRFLVDFALKTNPDFVLLQWYTNDVEGHDKSARPAPFPLIPLRFLSAPLEANSALFYLLNRKWETTLWQLGWIKSYQDYMLERFKDPDSPSSKAAMAELQKFIRLCKGRNIPMGIVLFHEHTELNFLPQRVLELCRREHLKCLNLRDAIDQYDNLDVSNRLDSHPGPLANAIVAYQLLETFGGVWQRHGR